MTDFATKKIKSSHISGVVLHPPPGLYQVIFVPVSVPILRVLFIDNTPFSILPFQEKLLLMCVCVVLLVGSSIEQLSSYDDTQIV